MPNWVKNSIKITGPVEDIAAALEIIRDKDPERKDEINFNNIIPMPERLNITSGGYDKYYVALYLKTLSNVDKWKLQAKLSDCSVSFYGNYFKKYRDSFGNRYDIPECCLNRMTETFREKYKAVSPTTMEDVGKAYIDNILEYGHDTWYEWCCHNWGTKWNACESRIFEDGFEFETAWSASFPIIAELSRRFPELTFHHEWADEDLGYNCGRNEVKNGLETEELFESDEEAYEFACMMWGYDPDEE